MNKTFMHYVTFAWIFFLLHAHACAASTTITPDANQTVASRNFWQLSRMLAYYQNAETHPWPALPSEPRLLKIGKTSQAVLVLRERLRRSGDLDASLDTGSKHFDRALAEAVASFQDRHGLKVDGAVGEVTRNELNIPPELRIKQITINLQRWANLSSQMGDRFIIVNIPDFQMHLFENNREILTLRAIVGKRELQTPELKSKITQIVLNPYWNIPPKIAQNDIAPKMMEDRSYMNRLHIRAFRVEDNDRSEISPYQIDWQEIAINGTNIHLRQEPGPENALGLVKFEFQNAHDVYMHDTSAKELFNKYTRDFSHGCIRLENPFMLVEYLMKDDPRWDENRVQQVIDSGKTTYVKIVNPIPIFITYITAWVDDQGRVNFRDDLYGLDDGIWDPSGMMKYDDSVGNQNLFN